MYLNVGYSKGPISQHEKKLSLDQPEPRISDDKARASVNDKDVTSKPKIAPKPRASSSETYYNVTSEDYYNSAEFAKGILTGEFKAYVAKMIQKDELLEEYKVGWKIMSLVDHCETTKLWFVEFLRCLLYRTSLVQIIPIPNSSISILAVVIYGVKL